MSRDRFFHVIEGALPGPLCDLILAEADEFKLIPATIVKGGDDAEQDDAIRRADYSYWHAEHWITGLITHFAANANQYLWHFDLTLPQEIQYVEYPQGGHHVWHRDEFAVPMDGRYREDYVGLNRKLSIRVGLSDPDEFEGGDTVVRYPLGHEEPIQPLNSKGSIAIIPSYVPVKINPVARGKRKYLEAWVLGPQFR